MAQTRKRRQRRRTLLTFGAFFVGGAVVGMLGTPRRRAGDVALVESVSTPAPMPTPVRERVVARTAPAVVPSPDAVVADPFAWELDEDEPARRSFGARLAFASTVAALFVCGGAVTAFGGDRFARLVDGSGTQPAPRVTHAATTPSSSESHQWPRVSRR
jgi:hypothetical protein